MANTRSTKKRVRQNEKRRQINLTRKSTVKTAIKKVLTAISSNEDVNKIKELMRDAESQIARAKNKVLHSNSANRKISRLAKKVAQVSAK